MPIDLTSGDRKVLVIAGGVLVLLVAGSIMLATGPDDTSNVPTTYSTGSGGAKAAYLLLKSSGYQVERWEQPLDELPDSGRLTLILAEPGGAPTADERSAVREFLARGGHVIATGMFAAFFLPEHEVVPDPLGGMTWKRVPSQSPSFITRAAPEITLAPQAYWTPGSSGVPLYGEDERPMVVKYSFAGGDVLWWASSTPMTNAGLLETGNLEFFLACLGADRTRPILWDEYSHGYRRSLAASAMRGPLKWMFLQIGLFTLAILLTYSRRSGPIVLPPAERRLSPLEFVRTLGSLYQRAGAASVTVDISYQRFCYWLTRRLGMSGNAPADELERAVRDRWPHVDPAFAAALHACEAARRDPNLKARTALKLNRSLYEAAATLELFGIRVRSKSDGSRPEAGPAHPK
jgi:hypothetical protein